MEERTSSGTLKRILFHACAMVLAAFILFLGFMMILILDALIYRASPNGQVIFPVRDRQGDGVSVVHHL